jgi:1-acyl-sn-glycerol-3-phosphate acyltransferase
MRSLERAAHAIRSGTDIWISPEGTRSRDGRLGEFRKGGFHLAMEAKAKILPMTIVGTREVLPAEGNRVNPGKTVFSYIHPPITTSGVTLDELMLRVRRAIGEP